MFLCFRDVFISRRIISSSWGGSRVFSVIVFSIFKICTLVNTNKDSRNKRKIEGLVSKTTRNFMIICFVVNKNAMLFKAFRNKLYKKIIFLLFYFQETQDWWITSIGQWKTQNVPELYLYRRIYVPGFIFQKDLLNI